MPSDDARHRPREKCEASHANEPAIEFVAGEDGRHGHMVEDRLHDVAERGDQRGGQGDPRPRRRPTFTARGPGCHRPDQESHEGQTGEDSVELDLADPGRLRDVRKLVLKGVADRRGEGGAGPEPSPAYGAAMAYRGLLTHRVRLLQAWLLIRRSGRGARQQP